jgi:hypothetical protein
MKNIDKKIGSGVAGNERREMREIARLKKKMSFAER